MYLVVHLIQVFFLSLPERKRSVELCKRENKACLYLGQIEASTSPPRAFDTFAVLERREFDYQSLPGGGEFDPHA